MLPNWLYGKSKSKLAELLGGGGTPSDYNEVKAQVTQNAEDILALSDALDDKAALTQITNPNLLDNPWFTVNQRGQSSYTASGYTVDRWKCDDLTDSGNTISVGDDGLTCTASGTPSKASYIREYFDGSIFDGSTFTASMVIESSVATKTYLQVRTSDNTNLIDSSGIDIPANTPTVVKASAEVQKVNGTCYIRAFFNYIKEADAIVKIKAIKLEKGSVSTLAMDIAPNYTTELLKCQRYFYRLDIPQYQKGGIGVAQVTNALTVTFFTPVNMIAKPSVTSNGAIRLRSGSNYIAIESILTYGNNNSNRFDLQFTTAQDALTVGTLYEPYATSGASYLDFSAEL